MGSEKREHITQIIENILDYRSEKKKLQGEVIIRKMQILKYI